MSLKNLKGEGDIFKKYHLLLCFALLIVNIIIDFLFFKLITIRGHLCVLVFETCIFSLIYKISEPVSGKAKNVSELTKLILLVFLIASLGAIYKFIFLRLLSDAHFNNIFEDQFPFVSELPSGIASIADGQIDVIAKVLWYCRMCLEIDQIPLNEPFIAYFYAGISVIAGEFNQPLIWLVLQLATFATAWILMKITREIYSSGHQSIIVALAYLIIFENQGVSVYLFKDAIVSLVLVILFYLNCRYIFIKNSSNIRFELVSILLIVVLYYLRSGMLMWIIAMTFVNIIVDKVNWYRHIRILILAALLLLLTGHDRTLDRLSSSVSRSVDKLLIGTHVGLDTHNFTYTGTDAASDGNSILVKANLHKVTISNFYFAPFVKGVLYFLLPLRLEFGNGISDVFHRLSTYLYVISFPFLFIGIFKIFLERVKSEIYLLIMLVLIMATILGAGPMIYPRYRILASAFFIMVSAKGYLSISLSRRFYASGISFIFLVFLVSAYDRWHAFVRTLIGYL